MVVIIGIPPAGGTFSFSPFKFLDSEKVLIDCYKGSINMKTDIPCMISLYKAGKLKLDELITSHFPLEYINEAIEAVEKGQPIIFFTREEKL